MLRNMAEASKNYTRQRTKGPVVRGTSALRRAARVARVQRPDLVSALRILKDNSVSRRAWWPRALP
jgi:hypothetical protein